MRAQERDPALADGITRLAIKVHRKLGPGLLEPFVTTACTGNCNTPTWNSRARSGFPSSTKTFKELMETTDWDRYGTGNYEKCADCMVHSGYEATAVTETIRRPWKALGQAVRGIRTDGPMAPEIPLEGQRPPEYVFSRHVEQAMARIAAKGEGVAEAAE